MRFLLDTNIMCRDLVRRPRGKISITLRRSGKDVFSSIIVAAELRLGAARKIFAESVCSWKPYSVPSMCFTELEPVDAVYGVIRAKLKQTGQPIGATDCS